MCISNQLFQSPFYDDGVTRRKKKSLDERETAGVGGNLLPHIKNEK